MPNPKRKRASKRSKKNKSQKRKAARRAAEDKGPDERLRFKVNTDLPDVPGIRAPKCTVISDRKTVLGHEKAYRYCALPIFAGERDISEDHVQKLWDRMKRGSFDDKLVTLATCRYDHVTYKINGQHTCWALVNMPSDYELQVREISYSVDTKEDLKSIYSMFDQSLPRSEGHLTKVRLADTEVTTGVHMSLISALVSGMKMWLFEKSTDRKRHRNEEMAMLVKEHSQTFRSVALMLQDNKDSIGDVKRQPVIACMMATYDKVPRMAGQFWGPVITGLDLTNKTDARWRLRKYLADHTTGATYRVNMKKSAPPEVMYRVCINCWNKWRKGDPMSMTPKATKLRVRAQ
ncbi:hypothetical protein LCGC14_0317650 [marine sediment metagenome]|uniref:Uncharacterized protein n=1 Tax=marine sediment metagenome TaxID=412755 RepID=A0A0F9W759_9ZZZZ